LISSKKIVYSIHREIVEDVPNLGEFKGLLQKETQRKFHKIAASIKIL